MKQLSPSILLASCALIFSASASAASLFWEDYDGYHESGPLAFLYEDFPGDGVNGSNDTYNGNFNILIDGFDPLLHVINAARVGFSFADDSGNDWEEYVDIFLDGTKIWNHLEVDGSHATGFDWHWQDVSSNAPVMGSLQDGILNYTVTLQELLYDYYGYTYKREDVWLKEAHLKVWGDYRVVPDSGATFGLLGVVLVGLAVVRRRLTK